MPGAALSYDRAVVRDREAELGRVEAVLGHCFSDRGLLERALRHGSAARAAELGSYQRLEFLGDAVLGAASALVLYERFPDADQGAMTRMRSHLTRSAALAETASLLGLDAAVEVGTSEELGRGRERSALLEDVLEALIGALLLDGGWEAALAFVRDQLEPGLDGLDERALVLGNPKSALIEAAQARGLPAPEFRQVRAAGEDHRPVWVFGVSWDGEEVARGEGRTKRQAQEQASRRALARLGLLP